MTETVIQTTEELATHQGMKGLKLGTKSGHTILLDLAWIAGVDYEYSDQGTESDNDYTNGNDR